MARLTLVCIAIVFATAVAEGQDPRAVDRPMPYMQAMNKIYVMLQTQASDATQNASSIGLVADMEWSTLSAKEAMPPRSWILTGADKDTMLRAYRRQLITLLRQELDLEEQLMGNDNSAAVKTLQAIEQTENAGHEKFR